VLHGATLLSRTSATYWTAVGGTIPPLLPGPCLDGRLGTVLYEKTKKSLFPSAFKPASLQLWLCIELRINSTRYSLKLRTFFHYQLYLEEPR
jgi:hypothetical protein